MNCFARETDTNWNRSAEALFGCLSPIRPPRRAAAARLDEARCYAITIFASRGRLHVA